MFYLRRHKRCGRYLKLVEHIGFGDARLVSVGFHAKMGYEQMDALLSSQSAAVHQLSSETWAETELFQTSCQNMLKSLKLNVAYRLLLICLICQLKVERNTVVTILPVLDRFFNNRSLEKFCSDQTTVAVDATYMCKLLHWLHFFYYTGSNMEFYAYLGQNT